MIQLLIKVKEENAKPGEHLNIKKTEILTTEEIHDFSIHKGVTEIVQGHAYSGSSSMQVETQPRNPEKAETQNGHNGSTRKGRQVQSCVIRAQGWDHPHPCLPSP